jgi:hypothetical protein
LYCALVNRLQSGDAINQGAFACSAATDNYSDCSTRRFKRRAIQNLQTLLTAAITGSKIVHAQADLIVQR